jgi:hypothetical protein
MAGPTGRAAGTNECLARGFRHLGGKRQQIAGIHTKPENGRFSLVRLAGIEPTTLGFGDPDKSLRIFRLRKTSMAANRCKSLNYMGRKLPEA